MATENSSSKSIIRIATAITILMVVMYFYNKCERENKAPGKLGLHYSFDKYGEEWPFTVPELWVYKTKNQIIALDPTGTKYGLNGNAMSNCKDCDDVKNIWRLNTPYIISSMHIMKEMGDDPFSISLSPSRIPYSKILDDFNSESNEENLIKKIELGKIEFTSKFKLAIDEQNQIGYILAGLEALRLSSEGKVKGIEEAAKQIRTLQESNRLVDYEFSTDSLKWIQAEFSKRLKKLQPILFKNVRRAYADELGAELWRDNMYVYLDGRTIEITGSRYANNGNMLDDFMKMKESLELFRFDKVIFKWYSHDDSPTSFKVDSKKDTDM